MWWTSTGYWKTLYYIIILLFRQHASQIFVGNFVQLQLCTVQRSAARLRLKCYADFSDISLQWIPQLLVPPETINKKLPPTGTFYNSRRPLHHANHLDFCFILVSRFVTAADDIIICSFYDADYTYWPYHRLLFFERHRSCWFWGRRRHRLTSTVASMRIWILQGLFHRWQSMQTL